MSIMARTRILNSATQLFHTRGYKAITMRDIAAEVGIRQPSLYYHFPQGKEELFVAVAQRELKRHQLGLQRTVDTSAPDLQSRLLAVVRWFDSQPPLNLLSMLQSDMPELSDSHRNQLFSLITQAIYQPIRAMFQQAIKSGEIRPVNPDLMTGTFIAMIEGFGHVRQANLTNIAGDTMAIEMISVIMDGLRPGSSQGESYACQ
jgi:AcrR family transcriptional regulator